MEVRWHQNRNKSRSYLETCQKHTDIATPMKFSDCLMSGGRVLESASMKQRRKKRCRIRQAQELEFLRRL